MRLTLQEVAKQVGGEVVGDGSTEITGVAGIREAGPGDLTFISNPRYAKYAAGTKAAALVVSRDQELAAASAPLLVVENPYDAFARVMGLFAPDGDSVEQGVHPSAVVSETASLGERVAVGANAVVEDGVVVGDGTSIHAGVFVGRSVRIGRDVTLYPNVTVRHGCEIGDRVIIHSGTVIGSDGFGFALALSECDHTKVPQIGNVVIEDDVEIGSNTCIDRGTLGSTRVCRGSKVDNLVQIAHNVVVGEGSVVVAQVGVSGSTVLGRGVVLAGQAGLVGHIEIGDGAVVGAQAGVTRSIPPGERVSGYPARKHSEAKRLYAHTENLPKLNTKVKALEERVARLEESPDED